MADQNDSLNTSNQTRDYEPDSGDFTTEPEVQEASDYRGVDYHGDGNSSEDDEYVISYEDQSLWESTITSQSSWSER